MATATSAAVSVCRMRGPRATGAKPAACAAAASSAVKPPSAPTTSVTAGSSPVIARRSGIPVDSQPWPSNPVSPRRRGDGAAGPRLRRQRAPARRRRCADPRRAGPHANLQLSGGAVTTVTFQEKAGKRRRHRRKARRAVRHSSPGRKSLMIRVGALRPPDHRAWFGRRVCRSRPAECPRSASRRRERRWRP